MDALHWSMTNRTLRTFITKKCCHGWGCGDKSRVIFSREGGPTALSTGWVISQCFSS